MPVPEGMEMTVGFFTGLFVGTALGAVVMAVISAGGKTRPTDRMQEIPRGETQLDHWRPRS